MEDLLSNFFGSNLLLWLFFRLLPEECGSWSKNACFLFRFYVEQLGELVIVLVLQLVFLNLNLPILRRLCWHMLALTLFVTNSSRHNHHKNFSFRKLVLAWITTNCRES